MSNFKVMLFYFWVSTLYALSRAVISLSMERNFLLSEKCPQSSFVRTSLFINASYGVCPVAGCGVDRKPISMSCIAEEVGLPSLCAICSVLLSTFMKLSASRSWVLRGYSMMLKPHFLCEFFKFCRLKSRPIVRF